MSSTPYIVLEKLGEGTYATVHKVSLTGVLAVRSKEPEGREIGTRPEDVTSELLRQRAVRTVATPLMIHLESLLDASSTQT